MSEHSFSNPLVVLYRALRSRPLLAISALAGLFGALVLPLAVPTGVWVRLIVGWNLGSVLYLALILALMTTANPDDNIIRHSHAVLSLGYSFRVLVRLIT